MTRYRFPLLLAALLASMCVVACGGRCPPVVQPPVDPPPPVCDGRDVVIYTLDAASRPIEGVLVTQRSTGRVDRSNGDGFTHRWACGPEDYEFQLEGWHITNCGGGGNTCNLAGPEHNVHLARDPLPIPAHPDPVVGAIWSDRHGCFGDDTGCRTFTIIHAGDLPLRWHAGGEAEVLADLDAMAAEGYHIVRMWSYMRPDGGVWSRGGSPPYPGLDALHNADYVERQAALLQAIAARGMRATLEAGGIRGLNADDERQLMQRFREAADRAGHWTVAWAAPVNEPGSIPHTTDDNGDNDPRHLYELVQILVRGTSMLWHLGGTDNERWDDPRFRFSQKFYTHPDQTFGYYHGTRALHWHDKIRRPFTWYYEAAGHYIRKWVDGEPFGTPCGPGVPLRTVTVVQNCHEVDAETIALAVAIKTFRGLSGLMSGNGVQRYQPWDHVIGWREVPWLVRQIPRDVATYTWAHHSGDTHRDKRVLVAKDAIRIDGVKHADGRFAYLVYGPKSGPSIDLRIERSFSGRLCDPVAMTCEDVSGEAGGTFPVSFTKGRLFVGRTR